MDVSRVYVIPCRLRPSSPKPTHTFYTLLSLKETAFQADFPTNRDQNRWSVGPRGLTLLSAEIVVGVWVLALTGL